MTARMAIFPQSIYYGRELGFYRTGFVGAKGFSSS
jgi:hypothetical protein